MKRLHACLSNEDGSALLVAVLLVPMLTILCIFAANISYQNTAVSTNDECRRDSFYDADGAVYGTAKLISLIGKSDTRQAVTAGTNEEAPGIEYLNSGADPAEYFRHLLTSKESENTAEDVKFIKADSANDIGLESTVDLTKLGGGTPSGGGAEFGSGGEGIGTAMNVVVFRMDSQGQSPCRGPAIPVRGDYWLIVSKDGRTKGI